MEEEILKKAEENTKRIVQSVQNESAIALSDPIGKKRSFDDAFNQTTVLEELYPNGNKKKVSTPTSMPNSVVFADKYAQHLGFLPMGGLPRKLGSNYIGRSKEIIDGKQKYKTFNQKFSVKPDTPDIRANINYYTSNLIKTWNAFVESEAELGNLLEELKTEKGRKEYILRQFKYTSESSLVFKILTSLRFFYPKEEAKRDKTKEKRQTVNILNLTADQLKDFKELLNELEEEEGMNVRSFESAKKDLMAWIDEQPENEQLSYVKNYIPRQLATIKTILRGFPEEYARYQKAASSETGQDSAYIPKESIDEDAKSAPVWTTLQYDDNGSTMQERHVDHWADFSWIKHKNYIFTVYE